MRDESMYEETSSRDSFACIVDVIMFLSARNPAVMAMAETRIAVAMKTELSCAW